jgi:hypothetical protein
MASSLSISRASSVMGSILDRSIDIPRDISFRGDFTLVDRSGGSSSKLRESDLAKLNEVSDGQVASNKTVIVNSDKNINGINEQTNTGKMKFDVVKNEDEGAVDLVFARARGNTINKTETYHRNHIGVISYDAYVNGDYIDTAGIDVNTYKKSYSNKYSGSEILFSNTGGSDINSGKHDSLKIDATGNTNILKSREIRLNTSRPTNYSSFRPAINTQSPGYTMELPANKGTVGDVLRINNVGYGGIITMTSNDQGVITEATISNRGQGYDPNYIPEVRTEVNMTGGKLRENDSVGGNTGAHTDTIILSSNAKNILNYYRGWIIETINPNFKRIIYGYTSSNKTATLSSDLTSPTTTLTQYKLSEGHFSGLMNVSSDGEIIISVIITFDDESQNYIVDNYFQNWTIYVDINSHLYHGTITSSTANNVISDYPISSSSNIIVVDWSFEIPTGTHSNRVFSLSNNTIIPASIQITSLDSNGEIDSIELHDGGRGYIPKVTIDVPISSQNRLEWSKNSLEVWGLDKIEGNCSDVGFTGSTTEFSYILINQTASLIDDGSSPLVTQISNGSWTVELTNKDSSITSWTKFYGVVRHYDHINGRLYINTGNSATENAIPVTNTTTLYKLVKYPESGFTGTYSNYSLLLGQESTSTDDPRYPESSNINNHYQGWLFISYGYGIYDIDDSFTGVITNYDSSTKNADVVLSNNNNGSFSGPSTYILSNSRPYGTSLKVGPGLTGGGNLANNVSVELDLSTHDSNGDTSNYALNSQNDKILIYSAGDTNTKMPTMTNFLSAIAGTGLTSSSNGLIVNNSQSFVSNISDNFKIYSTSGFHSSHYINIGKDDNENLSIKNEYNLSDNLQKTIIKTQTNQTERDTSLQFDIQDGVDVLTINDEGISVKRGIIESITISNTGSGYTTAPQITISPSPFGDNFTATATCTINGDGEVDSITITNKGLGYSSGSLPDITLTENPSGTSAVLTPVVNDSRHIIGQINNSNVDFDGYFRNLTISGDQTFNGTLRFEDEGAVAIANPSNLDFSEDNSTFLFGYNVGKGDGGIRGESNTRSTFVGYSVGYKSTNEAIDNTFYGFESGKENQGGKFNTFIGSSCGINSSTSDYNTYVGYQSSKEINGSYNTSLGSFAGNGSSLNKNITNNVFIGYNCLKTGLGGNYNTYVGDHSGFNSNCDDSVFIGFNSGYHSNGDGNVFVGREAGFNTDTSLFNTFIGYRSGFYINGNDSNVSSGYTGNAFMGYKSGYNLKGTSSRNIVIGPDAGPVEILTTDENYDASTSNIEHFKVYIDTRGPSNTPLLLGDQSDTTLQTIKLNADVTISKGNSGGTLEVEGGEVKIWAGGMENDSNHYKINFPKGDASYPYRNIQITNKNRGIGALTEDNNQYENTMIGFQMPLNPGLRNTLIGANAGANMTGYENTGVGVYALHSNTSGHSNTVIGKSAGYNITSGHRNVALGANAGNLITTGERNICIGYGVGPTTNEADDDYKLYIDTKGNGNGTGSNSLIYGDQSSESAQTLSFNADVTISKGDSGGTLEVEGGEVKIWAGGMANDSNHYKINFPKGDASYPYRNIQITNKNRGIGTLTGDNNQYENTMIGYQMPLNPGIRNTLIGGQAGANMTGYENTGVGVYALHSNTSGHSNTVIGKSAGYNITTGERNVALGYDAGYRITTGFRNICIGYGVGPTTNEADDDYKLYIDTKGDSNGTGSNSLIYGDQSGSNQDITFNADVVISNNTANSSGNLTVKGGLTVEGTLSSNEISASLTATSLTLQDNNIDVNPSDGRTSFGYNLFFTNNSHNVNQTDLIYNTFFGTYGAHLDITDGAVGNSAFGYHNLVELTTGGSNTSLGLSNMIFLTTGSNNVAVGSNNLRGVSAKTFNNCVAVGEHNFFGANGNGSDNIGIGHNNCYYVTGSGNIAIGRDCLQATTSDTNVNYSVCIGYACGRYLTSDNNTLIGRHCGEYLSGTSNVGMGLFALRFLQNGSNNVAIGYNACLGPSSGTRNFSNNIGIGYNALQGINSGSLNTVIGYDSGRSITSSSYNVFIGSFSGRAATSGGSNIGIGGWAGAYSTTGTYNVSIGYFAGRQTTGHRNISIGYYAGASTNETGLSDRLYIDNSRRGSGSLIYGNMSARSVLINGSFSVIGSIKFTGTLSSDLSGGVTIPSNKTLTISSINNVNITGANSSMYLGYLSGNSIKSSSSITGNTYIGYRTGRYSNSNADYNTFIGFDSGYYNSSGELNTFIGARAGFVNSSGYRNTCLGYYSGYYLSKGHYNTCLGHDAGPTGASSASFNLYIDPSSRKGTDSLIFGYGYGTATRYIRVGGYFYVKYRGYSAFGWTTTSDRALKKDILLMEDNINDKIDLLKPVTYRLKSTDKKDIGFIAQDVKPLFPYIVTKDKSGFLGIDYSKLTPYLVKGAQETNKKIRELEEKLEEERSERIKMKEFFLEEIKKLRNEIKNKQLFIN